MVTAGPHFLLLDLILYSVIDPTCLGGDGGKRYCPGEYPARYQQQVHVALAALEDWYIAGQTKGGKEGDDVR